MFCVKIKIFKNGQVHVRTSLHNFCAKHSAACLVRIKPCILKKCCSSPALKNVHERKNAATK